MITFILRLYKQVYVFILYICKVELATLVEGGSRAPFSIATSPRCREGHYSFPELLHFTLDADFIMLTVN